MQIYSYTQGHFEWCERPQISWATPKLPVHLVLSIDTSDSSDGDGQINCFDIFSWIIGSQYIHHGLYVLIASFMTNPTLVLPSNTCKIIQFLQHIQWPHLELVDGVSHVGCPTRLFDIQVTIILHTHTRTSKEYYAQLVTLTFARYMILPSMSLLGGCKNAASNKIRINSHSP